MSFAVAVAIRRATIADAYCAPKPKERLTKPYVTMDPEIWIAHATREAFLAGLRPAAVIGGCKTKEAFRARWKAWRRILEAHPNLSNRCLALSCGYAPATIGNGLQRLEALENRQAHQVIAVLASSLRSVADQA